MTECEHRNWQALDNNIIGQATCLDCGEVCPANVFINADKARVDALVERLEQILEAHDG